jgi:hypothetical protein
MCFLLIWAVLFRFRNEMAAGKGRDKTKFSGEFPVRMSTYASVGSTLGDFHATSQGRAHRPNGVYAENVTVHPIAHSNAHASANKLDRLSKSGLEICTQERLKCDQPSGSLTISRRCNGAATSAEGSAWDAHRISI